ncbi:hypothetical protein MUN88_18535 [Gracilibacillus caseinilyticus]|uniref:Uncharacterized protein n=1 Tax=Gracilibacillus caseinilyticus TaxID=2932256 RepID=A0ABY4EVZ9_9BACI|nr:hypothetical protein [Gracilibacillus caseinilyticus]UOQ48027.1 hypothetical protein MUN88_18535 [Gracilibacillus caseinilyticus]
MKNLITTLFLLFLIACSQQDTDETMITNEEMENSELPLTEEVNIENTLAEEENHKLEFVLDRETVTLNTENIPILKEFLSVISDHQQALADMSLENLDTEGLYLLSFNCNETTCSYLLLDRNEPNRTYLLDDLVLIKEIIPSPERNHLIFLYKQYDAEYFTLFNVEDWKVLHPQPELTDIKEIIEATWQDDETIDITYHINDNQEAHQQTISLFAENTIENEDK